MLVRHHYTDRITVQPIEITEIYPEFEMVMYRVGPAHFMSAYFNEIFSLRYLARLPKARKKTTDQC